MCEKYRRSYSIIVFVCNHSVFSSLILQLVFVRFTFVCGPILDAIRKSKEKCSQITLKGNQLHLRLQGCSFCFAIKCAFHNNKYIGSGQQEYRSLKIEHNGFQAKVIVDILCSVWHIFIAVRLVILYSHGKVLLGSK